MSKLSEYLKLIPGGIKNIEALYDGIKNEIKMEFGSLSEEEQEEIIRRRLICSTCPFMSTNAVKTGMYKTNRTDEHCIHCGCPIKTRTASLLANCGIETYNIKNPSHPMELKWEKYKKP